MRHLLTVLVLFAFTVAGAAQLPDTVTLRKYTQKEGLTSYNIRSLHKDKWGFIWIATQDGLSRFDGKRFINYTRGAPPHFRLCGTDVRAVAEDTARNLLWVLCGEEGISILNTVTGYVTGMIPVPPQSPEDWNITMTRNGHWLWVGTSTGIQVFDTRLSNPKPRFIRPAISPASVYGVRGIVLDDNKNVWVGYSGYGIVVYHGSRFTTLGEIKNAELSGGTELRLYGGVATGNETMLLATSKGLMSIRYNKDYEFSNTGNPYTDIPSVNNSEVQAITLDQSGNIFLSGGGHLYRVSGKSGRHEQLTEMSRINETDWLSAVHAILPEKNGSAWLGCHEGLAYLQPQTPFKPYHYDRNSHFKLNHVRSVFPLPNGDILAGLKDGLVKIEAKSGRFLLLDRSHTYNHIFNDKNGVTWLSRSDGLYRLSKDRIVALHHQYPELAGFQHYSINSHAYMGDSILVLGTENNGGVVLWNMKTHRVSTINERSSPARLSSGIVNKVFVDIQGALWILSDNVVSIIDPALRTATALTPKDPATGKPYNLFFDICEVGGNYWLASYGAGLLRVDKKGNVTEIINTGKGLSNDAVYQVYSLTDQRMIATSNNGISVVDLEHRLINRYYQADGLHGNGFEEASGCMMGGKIFSGGLNGFTVIEPKHLGTYYTAPRVYITGAEMKGEKKTADTSNLHLQYLEVPVWAEQTTLYFSAIDYANPGQISFAYRFKGTEDWIENGSQPFIQLIGSPPGQYAIEVRARTANGPWSQPAQLRLRIMPRWYQTIAFRIAIALLVLSITYLIYRSRINQVRREENIRRRLATDLHDDIGSTLNSVKVYTSLAEMDGGNREYLFKIREGTQEAIAGVRDIIWILDDEKDTAGEMLDRLVKFTAPLCEAEHIQFEQCFAEGIREYMMKREEKRNVYLMLKEIINNTIRHSGGDHLVFEVSLHQKKPRFIITDNGIGFDPDNVKKGNGLDNIVRRCRQIGYSAEIRSKSGAGTTIIIAQQ